MANKLIVMSIMFFLFLNLVNADSFNNSYNPTTPTYHLIGGNFSEITNYNNFETLIDSRVGLSDGLDSTDFNLTLGEACGKDYMKWYYQFNDVGGSEAHDSSNNNHDLVLLPFASFSDSLDYYSLNTLAISGSGADSYYTSDHDIGDENFTMGVVINTTSELTNDQYVFSRFNFVGAGYGMGVGGIANNYEPFCIIDTNNGSLQRVNGVGINITDGQAHYLICSRNIETNNLTLYVDGVQVGSIKNGNVGGAITSTNDLIFSGIYLVGINGYTGQTDEAFLLNGVCPSYIFDYISENKIRYNKSTSNSVMAYFNHSIDLDEFYSLKINVDVEVVNEQFPFRVYSHLNMTDINETNYIDQLLNDGENYIDVSTIIYDGYDLPFRMNFLESNGNKINGLELFEVGNDTTNPDIWDCQTDLSFVGCNDSVTWKCRIQDDVAISKAFGVVSVGGAYNITREVFHLEENFWGITFSPEEVDILFQNIGWQFNQYVNVTLVYMNATDIAGNTQENFTSSPTNTYGCLKCFEDWELQPQTCLINDSQFTEYLDNNLCNNTPYNIALPSDNGTFVSCNYCNPNIQTQETECVFSSGTYIKNITYVDNLYYYCCAITGLDSDCGVDLYPLNETQTEFCTIFNNSMDCDSNTFTEYGFFADKVRWLCYPPVDFNTSTYCMSYVKDPSSGVLQTNPNYFTRADSILAYDNEIEDRTSFEAVGNIVSVYFTKDNLIFDGREYVYGVRCTNNGQYYTYEQLIKPEYENVSSPITRWFWIKDNLIGLFIGGIILAFIIFGIALHLRELRRR